MDLYTFGGGLSEPRASLLANRGYVVLALAYYGYQDLPKKPKMLDLEYFEEAVTYLRVHPEVSIKINSGELFLEGFLLFWFCFLILTLALVLLGDIYIIKLMADQHINKNESQ